MGAATKFMDFPIHTSQGSGKIGGPHYSFEPIYIDFKRLAPNIWLPAPPYDNWLATRQEGLIEYYDKAFDNNNG